ncbi:hypothetical protein BpHYR1_030875 [Brachionus plicatilis]|uniref:ZP domain-containing protein n=1 Tax=Brachionus plicatilis TaxID=10195 RepID=A0A3M7QID1_BRAPC|nr:hypothetical protein BpHYR1_030875 [Brachionus plicatilis]
MAVYDPVNNRPVSDGGSVFVGDKLLIDIKLGKKELGLDMDIENCSMSAEENSMENIDLIYKGCPVINAVTTVSLSFRKLDDYHMQSNLMQVFKLKSTQSVVFKCWTKICLNKCSPMPCESNLPNSRIRLLKNETEFAFKKTETHLTIDNPFGLQVDSKLIKDIDQLPQVIELQVSPRPFSGLIKAILVSAIMIVFAMMVSIISIVVYRWLNKRYGFSADRTENTESICHTSESCKYDMNSRNFQDSYFQNQTEPLSDATRCFTYYLIVNFHAKIPAKNFKNLFSKKNINTVNS